MNRIEGKGKGKGGKCVGGKAEVDALFMFYDSKGTYNCVCVLISECVCLYMTKYVLYL